MNIAYLIPISVICIGAFFLIRLKGFFILHPLKTLKRFFKALRMPGAFENLTLALAGTLGVGNIFGVAAGIAAGGAGCLFWLIVAALFSSVIKYSEAVVASDCHVDDGECRVGGMMYVLSVSFKRWGRAGAFLYAALCLSLTFVMGCAFQCSSAVSASDCLGEIDRTTVCVLLTVTIALLLLFGKHKIERVTTVLIPLAAAVYVLLCICVLFTNRHKICDVLTDVIKGAFEIRAALGGIGAFLFNSALREGFSKGILSNEAGVGTSVMANVRTYGVTICESGLFGMCEVFFDSVVLCTLTGLTILTGVEDISLYRTGAELIGSAFKSSFLGGFAPFVLFFSICCFAVSTVICWYFYGSVCRAFLFGRKFKTLFAFAFIISVFVGSFIPEGIILGLTDVLLASMSVLTAACLIKKSDRVVALSEIEDII